MTPQSARRELWLSLAQALLPPLTALDGEAFQDTLPTHLRRLCTTAGINAGSAIDALAGAAARVGSDGLLVHYSQLFLAPPTAARLNAATCLQGTVNGPAMDAIETMLGRYGVMRNERFHDTADHLSSLLELLVVVTGIEGSTSDQCLLTEGFLVPAAQRLRSDIARSGSDSPYLHLVDILSLALAPLRVEPGASAAKERMGYDHDPSKGIWRKCSRCGQPIAREKELEIIARALEKQGLGTEHLDRCPDCRSPAPTHLGLAPVCA
ncbi:MAG: molecular chaperone TorD family protein [Rhodoferax sp.]